MSERLMKESGVEWVGKIPDNWNTARIKNIADPTIQDSFMDGDWIESPYITTEGIKYFTTGNVGDGTFKYQGDGYISSETFEKLKCKYAYGGDLIISRLNEPYGRSCLIPAEIDKCVLAVDIVILRPKRDYDRRYICYLTMCDGYHRSIEDKARGTAMKRISRNNLGNIVLPVPSFQEQARIADFLDKKVSEIDAVISKTKKSIEEYKKLKQSIITEAVTKGLDPNVKMKESGVYGIGKIPANWQIEKLKYLSRVERGGSPRPIEEYLTNDENGINWIKIGDTEKGNRYINKVNQKIIPEGVSRSRFVEKGTLLLTNSMSFGEAYILNVDGCIHDGWVAINKIQKVDKDYLYYQLTSDACILQFKLQVAGGVVQNLNIDKVGTTSIVLPPIEEQIKIVSDLDTHCSKYNGLISKKEQVLTELEQYKKSLIYECVTGKKEVLNG